jgi:hypothetical protein
MAYIPGYQQAIEVPNGTYNYQTVMSLVVGVLRNEMNRPFYQNGTEAGSVGSPMSPAISPSTTLLSCGCSTTKLKLDLIRYVQDRLGLPGVTFEFPDVIQAYTDTGAALNNTTPPNPIAGLVTINDAVNYITQFL